ncbi:Toxin-antitoxin system, antitoxin component, Xre family [Neochlamydia sp. TUME1]|uniref:XRE family transcriptional regulator n=1 Tax=Neochlamydia sp. TUME1 TaxID=1478174 RepID=UPI000580412B|nr:XRE family transcriptional regulator [Neochlamydia sp. TUME1]KIC73612.1 Toxin-antitoxin system, antitoxin component, Xre family [Neochlamydia sp. TUME1]
MRKKTVRKNKHLGSDFDDFLREEGILEECEEVAAKYAFVMQLEDEIKKQNLTKEEFAKRMKTSRSALNRLLDPTRPSNLTSFVNAALAIGRHVRVNLV